MLRETIRMMLGNGRNVTHHSLCCCSPNGSRAKRDTMLDNVLSPPTPADVLCTLRQMENISRFPFRSPRDSSANFFPVANVKALSRFTHHNTFSF